MSAAPTHLPLVDMNAGSLENCGGSLSWNLGKS
jgi:hypothetical protein